MNSNEFHDHNCDECVDEFHPKYSVEEEEEMIRDAYLAMEGYKRKRALEALFEKSSICWNELSEFNIFMRAFCWVKTLICLLLSKTGGSYLDEDSFCILAYDEFQGMENQNWEACFVTPHIFSNWNVCVCTDGT